MKKRCFNCMKEYDDAFEVCPHCGYIENMSPQEPFFLKPGEILNRRYIVGTAIEHGGFGIVYRAWDAQMEQMVAIKEYFPAGVASRLADGREVVAYSSDKQELLDKGVQRYLTEARNQAVFNHPDIVALFGYFEENNTAYIVMEYLDGISLKNYMAQSGQGLSVEETLHITRHVLDALSEIHSYNIVHRDVSPDNIFLCTGNRVKLIDFGAARFSSGDSAESYSTIVKPGYAPAEQYRGKSSQGPFTDLYAVGACMYHMLTGIEPIDSMSRIIDDVLEEPQALNPEIPDYLNRIIMKAMAMKPEDRYQSVAAFLDDLDQKESPAPSPVRPPDKPIKKKKSRKLPIIAAVVALLILAAVGLWAITTYTRLIKLPYKGELYFYIPDSKKEYYEDLVNDYNIHLENGNLSIELEVVPDKEYKDKVLKAEEKKEAAIFLSDSFTEKELEHTEDLKEYVYDKLNGGYYYLDDYSRKNEEMHKIPQYFMVPFMVENLKYGKKLDTGVHSIQDFSLNKAAKKGKSDIKTYEVKENVLSQVSVLQPEEDKAVKAGDPAAFLSGKAAYYVTDWRDFHDLVTKSNNMDLSILYPAEGTSFSVRLMDYVSISDEISIPARMAAENFVLYMLQNQDDIYMASQPLDKLPLNKEALKSFSGIYVLNLMTEWNRNNGDEQFIQYIEGCSIQ